MADTTESLALAASRRLGQAQDPAAAAAAFDAERELGVPFDVASRQPAKVNEIRRQRNEIPSDVIVRDSPALARFMTKPAQAALTRDDIPNLMQLEQSIANPEPGIFSNTLKLMGNTTNELTGAALEFLGKLGQRASTYAELGALMLDPNSQKIVSPAARAVAEASQIVQDTGTAVSEGQGYDYIPKYTLDRMLENPTPANIAGIIVEQGGGSIPHMIGMLASLPAYSVVLSEQIAQERAKNNGKQDATLEDTAAMLPISVAIAMLDKFSFTKATQLLQGAGVLRQAGRSAIREAGTEIAQEEVQYAAESIGTDEGFKPQVALERGATAALVGAGMGGALTMGSAPLQAAERRRQRNMTEELASKFEQAALDQQLDLVKNSVLRQTSAPKFQEFLATVSDGKNLYLSPDVLPELESAGITLPFLEGKSDGEQDLQITYSDIASVVDDDKVMKVLRPYLKRTTGAMSQAEQEQAQKERETMSGAEIQTLIEAAAREQQTKSQLDAIHDEVAEQLVATGRQGPATARYSVETITSYIAAKVDELQREKGVTLSPREVYDRFGLGIQKMEAPSPTTQSQSAPVDTDAGVPLNQIELQDEYVDEAGQPATVTITADKALEDIDTRMDNAKKLIACLRK